MLTGVKNLDESLLRRARSFGASDIQIFRTIALPGSVPYLLSGLRLGLGHALIGVVVGELTAATAGIGFLISISGAAFRTDKVMVGVLIVAGMGVVCTAAIKRIENHFQSWRAQRP
jgi:NitT/TauT family transport system permease protein